MKLHLYPAIVLLTLAVLNDAYSMNRFNRKRSSSSSSSYSISSVDPPAPKVVAVVHHQSPSPSQDFKRPVAILRSLNQANDDGSFNYNFESEDGIKVEAAGNQKLVGSSPEEIGTVQRGSYSYTAPDGTLISVSWTADENGFRASGAHLPVAPPMPDHVVKMLDDLRAAGRL